MNVAMMDNTMPGAFPGGAGDSQSASWSPSEYRPEILRGYRGAGDDPVAAFIATATAAKDQVTAINDSLYKALAALSARNTVLNFTVTDAMVAAATNAVESWHGVAVDWMNQLGGLYTAASADATAGAVTDSTQAQFDHWLAVAKTLAATGISTAGMVNDYASESALSAWSASIIPALQTAWQTLVGGIQAAAVDALQAARVVLSEAVKTVEEPLADAAWGTGKVLLILGAAAAAVIFLFKKSGVRASVGPVSLSGYQKRGMRHVRQTARAAHRRGGR